MAASPIVDLPAPDSPMRPSTSRRRNFRSMPLTISCQTSSLLPATRSPRISSNGAPGAAGAPTAEPLSALILQSAGLVQEPIDHEIDGNRQQRDGSSRQQGGH